MVDHYYSEKQETAYNPFLIKIHLNDDEFELYSASGVFSIKSLDKGTETLLKYCKVKGKVLDLGCGYGVVGISLLRKNPQLEIFFVDISERAIKLTKKNLDLLNLKGIFKKSNIFEKINEEIFDTILTNPPYSAGREVCINFIKQSFEHLNKKGSLQLVCRRRKGGDFLEKKMEEIFGNCEVIGQKSGFRVYKSEKK